MFTLGHLYFIPGDIIHPERHGFSEEIEQIGIVSKDEKVG